MKKYHLFTLSAAAVFFFVSVPMPLFATSVSVLPVQAEVSRPKSAGKNGNEKIVGSIAITDNPEDIVSYAKERNLQPAKITDKANNRPALVTFSELPNDPKVQALARQKGVSVVPNYAYEAFFVPNDPRYGEQWNLPKVSAPQAWDVATGSSDVTVAVIDTGTLFEQTINGTAYNQPDFTSDRLWTNPAETGMTQEGDACWTGTAEDKSTNVCDDSGNGLIDDWRGWDFMGGFRGDDEGCPNHSDSSEHETTVNGNSLITQDNDPQPYSCDSPDYPSELNKNHYDGTCQAFVSACFVGHGTMVASVAAATTNNSELIAGLDHQSKIMNIRVLDGYGWGSTDRLVGGLYYAADNGADVINLSLGSNCGDESFSDPLVEDALQAAADAGVVIVAASGNGDLDTVCYPASSKHVMAIGATDSDDKRESYSSYSSDGKLDVVAPAGVPVANAPSNRINSNYYANAGGTSLSTPHVAGLASLLIAENPSASRDDIRKKIQYGSDRVSGMEQQNFHNEYGYGRINMYRSLTSSLASLEERNSTIPVYRLYSPERKYHFYTSSSTERDRIVETLGFRYENVGFRARLVDSDAVMPVYRLYRSSTGSHLYTTSKTERDRAVSEHGFKYEGVGFYALRQNGTSQPPVYRLYRSSTGSHLYTTSKTERDRAVSEHGFKYEKVAFYSD